MNRIEKLLNDMTLEEKVGQMTIVRAYQFWDKTEAMVSEGTIGAIGHVYLTKEHERTLEETVKNINHLKSIAKLPLFFYLDGEEGLPMTFRFGTPFPAAMALGATFSKELACEMGRVIGEETKALGFDIISNPTVDINTNSENPIIGTRSCSDNTELVCELNLEYVKGMQAAGVIPLGKHFPGHGDTSEDSHIIMPVVEHYKAFLLQRELKPYEVLSKAGMWGVMTAHIIYPGLQAEGEDRLPATLSRSIITGLLREELGFGGLIISDSLSMKGIKNVYGIEKSAVMAVQAGHDMILQDYASDPSLATTAVIAAVRSGLIPGEQIDASVRRILEFKEKLGLLENKPVDAEAAGKAIGTPANIQVAKAICDSSITLLEAADLPFRPSAGERVLVVATKGAEEGVGAEDLHALIGGKSGYLLEQCRKYAGSAVLHVIDENPGKAEADELVSLAKEFDTIIFGSFIRIISYKEGSGSIPDAQAELVMRLDALGKRFGMVIFGSPYSMKKLPGLKNCMCAYSDCIYSIEASMKVAFGELKAKGRLPVNVSEKYPFGYGIV